MMVYYNEFDPFAAAWISELIKEGVIADGEVDTRDFKEVTAADVRGFTQCHFFAGIGGWSLALRLAGWPDDRPVWTGSCPCQPFSAAGAQIGGADPRHLWPTWFQLIKECKPAVVFGEQVAAAINHGWIDLVFDDLEREAYACGAVDIPACGVGAFHIRQRLWFVADSYDTSRRAGYADKPGSYGGRVGNAEREGLEGHRIDPSPNNGGRQHSGPDGSSEPTGAASFWRDVVWIPCRDGKARPIKPGIFPLAHGVSNRVGTLRGAGNAIVPEAAQAFIEAYLHVRQERG